MRPSCPRAALAAGVALAAAGCGGGGDARPAPRPAATPAARVQAARAPSDAEQVAALLARRARALEAGDPAAYAATATGAQRARDRRAARRSRGLGVAAVGLTPARLRVADGRATMTVRSQYSIRRVAGRFASDRRVVALRTARGWRVASEETTRGREPWELAAYRRSRSTHFVVLAPAGLALDGLHAALEAGYATMRDVLPSGRLRRRFLVVVAGGSGDARRLTRGIQGVETLAAITDSQVRERGAARRAVAVVSQRLLVVWPVFRGLDPAARERIVTHELTHAALAGSTSGRTPGWLVEGVALYVSGDRRLEEAAAAGGGPSLSRLGAPDGIARLSGARQADGYAYASAAAFYVAGRFGRAGLLRLYDAFGSPSVTGPAGARATADRAVRRALGVSLRRLERDLRRRLRAVRAPS